MKYFYPIFFCFIATALQTLQAQVDSIIFINRNYIVGEVKEMDRGVLTIETDYSDSDFMIEWKGISEIYTQTAFLITLSDGSRFNGRLESTGPKKVNLISEDDGTIEVDHSQIVFLKSVDESFASRLSASIDLGFSITRSQNLQQFTLRSNLGYLAERWSAAASYNSLNSTQDDVEPTDRTDANLTFRYYLPKDWYVPVLVSFLSNTEQKLALRTTVQLGIGKYVIHTNRTYWGFSAGASYNNETFYDDNPERRSMEGFFGSELNMYDIGDLSLLTKIVAFPGFTESGRWRTDFTFDAKYDLPLDFYIKLGFTLNFDNQPVEGAGRTDYVLQTGFGWEW